VITKELEFRGALSSEYDNTIEERGIHFGLRDRHE